MNKTIQAGLMSAVLLLAACSDDDDSSSSGAAGGTEAAAGGQDSSGGGASGDSGIAGTYVGPATATLTGPGISETASRTVQVVIGSDNSVAFGDPGSPPAGTAVLAGDGRSFSVNVPAAFFNRSGIECEGVLVADGVVDGPGIAGTIASREVRCSGIPLTVDGSFDLERTAAGTQGRAGAGLLQQLKRRIPALVE